MKKKITITEDEYLSLKTKAEKWDELGKEIERFYLDGDGNVIEPDFDDGLINIGDMAASAYGWL